MEKITDGANLIEIRERKAEASVVFGFLKTVQIKAYERDFKKRNAAVTCSVSQENNRDNRTFIIGAFLW